MEAALRVLNEMVADGVLVRYAIGGAMGALFYVEPVATYDLDVFVELPAEASRSLAPLERVYAWLRSRSYAIDREHVLVEGMAVQILPAFNGLVEEAVREATSRMVGGVESRVCTAEHLVAILVQTGRPKDRARLALFLEEAVLDPVGLREILARHGLVDRWDHLRKQIG